MPSPTPEPLREAERALERIIRLAESCGHEKFQYAGQARSALSALRRLMAGAEVWWRLELEEEDKRPWKQEVVGLFLEPPDKQYRRVLVLRLAAGEEKDDAETPTQTALRKMKDLDRAD